MAVVEIVASVVVSVRLKNKLLGGRHMYLALKEIKKYYGEGENRIEVLKGINCEIEKGEICVLLGPSGSGKSTLLNLIGGIEEFDDGVISIDGETLKNMNEKRLSLYRRKNLGYVFQFYNLIQNLTVKENIEVGAYLSDNPLELDDLLHTLGLWEHLITIHQKIFYN